jgi:hypothetical protein
MVMGITEYRPVAIKATGPSTPDLAEGFECPASLGYRMAPAQNVKVPIFRADLEKDIVGTVPLIQNLFNDVRAFTDLEA